MANYRQIHVSIWKDNWFLDLEPVEKLLFVYLFSNESASLAGIYKIPLKVISFETCLPLEFVIDTLKKFESEEKVYYRDGMVWVKNLRKYNRGGATVEKRIQYDLADIDDCELKRLYLAYYEEDIPYEYPSDSLLYEEKLNEEKLNELKGLPTPRNAREAEHHPLIDVFRNVTDRYPGVDQYQNVIDTILYFLQKFQSTGKVEEFLKPYWLAWDNRKTANGRAYRKSNLAWMTEWAINGEIPPPTKNEPKGMDIATKLKVEGYEHRRAD